MRIRARCAAVALSVRLVSLLAASVMALLAGCATGPSGSSAANAYSDARQRYADALERDLQAGRFPHVRLVAIPPSVEPFKPGAAFKPGVGKPLAHACIVSEQQMPEAVQIHELWPEGQQPRFTLSPEATDMLAVAAQQVAAVSNAITLKQAGMVSLADTTRIALVTNDLLAALRTDACLDTLVAQDVSMVQGIIYGAEAISSSKYLDVGARQETLQNNRYRVMHDGSGSFYVQETKVRPKYWMVSGFRVDLKVDRELATPAQRTAALRAFVAGQGGELVASERRLSDQEVQALGEALLARRGSRPTR